MKKLLFIFLLGGCAYVPTTKAGISCKRECAKLQLLCNGEESSCRKAYQHCTDTCQEQDDFDSGEMERKLKEKREEGSRP